MMNGSLVCLSPDDFETFFFATVAGQRDAEKLAKGEFQIKLEVESYSMPEITSLITYVMVESHVYFEVCTICFHHAILLCLSKKYILTFYTGISS